ncbi:hypothetical protein MMU07_04985 [Aquiflexum sp. LQ15W]|uniref:hypothetical protein n=1 Tax=Cognataquiflexum nitidum TaxID=2922272 RepID=UPI001F13AC02|nr:hypothetical protein [Cognataquiflexum nitidum]MCH6198921.1 hypothetical protein [Cognataquiflexum nitidum]
MKNISRKAFIKQTIGIGISSSLIPLNTGLFAFGNDSADGISQLMEKLVKGSNKNVSNLLKPENARLTTYTRQQGYDFAILCAAYSYRSSSYFQKREVIERLKTLIEFLLSMQNADGTMDSGNLESPPDTAFVMEPLCAAAKILLDQKDKNLEEIKSLLQLFIVKAGEGLLTGGIHTPNHRWVLSSALAKINRVYPDKRYVARIDEWLSEGIFIDKDGHYPERSMNYSAVENEAFITMARLLNRDELLEPVRINLRMTYYYMEPNGDLVTFDSRRQDQYSEKSIINQYLNYRFIAIKDKDPFFAAICGLIEKLEGFENEIIDKGLYYFIEEPFLQNELPIQEKLPLNYETVFSTSSLARIRRNEMSMTIFGGVDWPLIIASGRSISPNFFSFRKGAAILKHMRISSSFFNMGHFRSNGLEVDDGVYTLYKKLEAPYYQPLPENLRRPDGDYDLTPSVDGRFWSKMSFEKRPVSNVKTLETKVKIKESNGEVSMEVEVIGLEGVPVTIELCFHENGILSGVESVGDNQNNSYLPYDFGTFSSGKDRITFGPGLKKHQNIYRLDGEMYSVHFGTLRGTGQHVYLTGYTPFSHTLTFK